MYLELEAELEQLIPSLAEADLSAEAQWEAFGVGSCPRNASFVVSEFPRCRDDVASLAKVERRKLSAIAALIVSRYRPGCAPFLQVEVLGTDNSEALALAATASASDLNAPEITVRVRAAMLNNLRKWMVEDHVTPSF